MPLSLAVYADIRTMPNAAVFPIIHRDVGVRDLHSLSLAPHSTAEERMMIAEEYLTRSRLCRRLRNGPHGSYVELYALRLVEIGLNRRGTWRSLNIVGDLLSWLMRIGSTPTELNERLIEEYLLSSIDEAVLMEGRSGGAEAFAIGPS